MADSEEGDNDQAQSRHVSGTTPAATAQNEDWLVELPITPALQEVVNTRLSLLVRLRMLEHARQELLQAEKLPAEAKDEIERQGHDLRRFPTAAQTRTRALQLQELWAALQSQSSPPHPLHLQAIQISRQQCALFIERDRLVSRLLQVASAQAVGEALFILLEHTACQPHLLFGWAIYALAVRAARHRATARRQALTRQLAGAPRLAIGGEALPQQIEQTELLIHAAARELAAIEPAMVEAFWNAYAEAAAALVSAKPLAAQQRILRAFLRYGMIGGAPWFLSPAAADDLLRQSEPSIQRLSAAPDATHVLHADEYIQLVAQGMITPSIDEELELNHRSTPQWMWDKAWRRAISARIRQQGIESRLASLEAYIRALEQENAAAETKLRALPRSEANYPQSRDQLRQHIQDNKVEIARRTRAIERLRGKLLPEEQQRSIAAEQKLQALGGAFDPEQAARQEAGQIHRICNLCAKLHDPFPPYLLRHDLHRGAVNDRQTIQRALAAIEKADPTIFKEVAVYANKPTARTYIRYSPYILIAPVGGSLGFSWNPRGGTEVGRLVLPAYCPHGSIMETILPAVCADFRWDTSKQSAGMDVLTSDTLVAAYATVRWEYRKRSPEVRQKAGIYSSETDRKNWRRHYAMYLSSAMEGGRKLFFKCNEIYEVVVKYLGLPEGVQKLQR